MKKYTKPQIHVVHIKNADIIATSMKYYDGPSDWSNYDEDVL